jgi:threonine/homoserine/homoserine lactone efflux protein
VLVKEAIGQVLSFGVGVTISPIPIIAVVLMLATPRGRVNGPAFLAGWVLGLAAAGTITLLVASGADAASSDSSDGVNWVKIGLGVLLLVVALRQWRRRPAPGTEPAMPKWMQTIDAFSPVKALGAGVLLSALNPKNLLLVVGAGLAISQTGASTGDQAVALAVFVVIGTIGPGTPVAIFFFMQDRAERLLGGLKTWMTHSNAAIMAVLCLVIGAKLIGDGLAG